LCFCKNSRNILKIYKKLYIAFEKNVPLFTTLVKIGQKYWTIHEELQAFLYKAGGQISQYLCPFHRVPEDSGLSMHSLHPLRHIVTAAVIWNVIKKSTAIRAECYS
jgi:hypothetical protein